MIQSESVSCCTPGGCWFAVRVFLLYLCVAAAFWAIAINAGLLAAIHAIGGLLALNGLLYLPQWVRGDNG